MTRRPVFLERRAYRRRRAMDGARILPVVGAFLFLLPLIWTFAPGSSLGTAGGGIYIFAVWAGLFICALLFARTLSRPDVDDRSDGKDRPER